MIDIDIRKKKKINIGHRVALCATNKIRILSRDWRTFLSFIYTKTDQTNKIDKFDI